MKSLDELINTSTDVRELKRALSVKMVDNGLAPITVSELLNVSLQYVSKWKVTFDSEGADGLGLAYHGRECYLNEQERETVVAWINGHETLSVEELRDYTEAEYGIVYQSKQSYYALLEAGGMSYHKSEKQNPKRDETQVQERRQQIHNKLESHREAIECGDIVVLLEDECHLLWGDACGMVWGKRNTAIEVAMTNERERQTYYGAVNLLTHEFHLKAFPAGKGEYTVAYVRWLRELYPEKSSF